MAWEVRVTDLLMNSCPSFGTTPLGSCRWPNAGPGTNGSQFFITHVPTPHLDDAHTIFGSVKSEEDQKIVDQIEQGDQIQTIKIVGEYEELLSSIESVSDWNDVLDSDSDS